MNARELAELMREPERGRKHRPNRVKRVRERLLLTQAELARLAGVSTRTITGIEAGLGCTLPTRKKILVALGIPIERADEIFPAQVAR